MSPFRKLSNSTTIKIGRMGSSAEDVDVSLDDNLADILDDNGYKIGPKEKVHLNSEVISKGDLKKTKVTKNSVVVIQGPKEGGIR